MEDLPKRLETELLESKEVEVSDWVKKALETAEKLEIYPYEESLARKLIQKALKYAEDQQCPSGVALAAAFDLFITTEYYKAVTNKGWFYCPQENPSLFFPYTNTCPRCILADTFHFEVANKPPSGSIGKTTSRLLSVFLDVLFKRANNNLIIYKGSEPVDMLIYDQNENVVLLAEIKASPLTTLALAVSSDEMTEPTDGGESVPIKTHIASINPFLNSSELHMFLPVRKNGKNSYRFVSLGMVDIHDETWAYKSIEQVLDRDSDFFDDYLAFWLEAFEAYKVHYRSARRAGGQIKDSNTFWFTNACGQPNPRPDGWPARKGTGYESVSDGKTSVGMDRTDDIKKGIYQVMKIGAESKPNYSQFKVKTALISNIHAVRHYSEYLHSLEDIVWLIDKSKKAKTVGDLPDDTNVYNLFDGIISFTESHLRDEWIEKNFRF